MKYIVYFLGCVTFLASLHTHAEQTELFLSHEDMALFFKQGYLLKRDCIDRREIEQLSNQTNAMIQKTLEYAANTVDRSVPAGQDQILYIDGARIVVKAMDDGRISIARINGVGGMQPDLLKTMRSEKMVRTIAALLCTNQLEHIICQMHPKMPGDGIAFARHQDIKFRTSFDPEWKDILGNGSYAIAIIPLDRWTQENGGLWIDKKNYPENKGEEPEILWIDARPGDLLFMHPLVFHGSGPNVSATDSRRTLLTGFCAFGANHKVYPGAQVNTHISVADNGAITMQQAPWRNIADGEGNH
jgi:hypothetical protein